MSVEESIKQYIEDNGIRQNFVGEKSGISPALLSRILRGERKLRASEFLSICTALNLDPRNFMEKGV